MRKLPIDILHVPDLNLKLYFPIRVISLTTGKMISGSIKSNGKGCEFEYNFVIICRYLNREKKTEVDFIANKTIATTFNFFTVSEKKCYFSWTLDEIESQNKYFS